jgi:hypothetical protein
MDGIGSIGALAVAAAQPFSSPGSSPAVTEATSSGGGSAASGGSPISANVAGQYQMTVLSKVLYASADQALSLIQMLPKSSPLLR